MNRAHITITVQQTSERKQTRMTDRGHWWLTEWVTDCGGEWPAMATESLIGWLPDGLTDGIQFETPHRNPSTTQSAGIWIHRFGVHALPGFVSKPSYVAWCCLLTVDNTNINDSSNNKPPNLLPKLKASGQAGITGHKLTQKPEWITNLRWVTEIRRKQLLYQNQLSLSLRFITYNFGCKISILRRSC